MGSRVDSRGSTDGQFTQVTFEGTLGWVSTQFLTPTAPGSALVNTSADETVYIRKDGECFYGPQRDLAKALGEGFVQVSRDEFEAHTTREKAACKPPYKLSASGACLLP